MPDLTKFRAAARAYASTREAIDTAEEVRGQYWTPERRAEHDRYHDLRAEAPAGTDPDRWAEHARPALAAAVARHEQWSASHAAARDALQSQAYRRLQDALAALGDAMGRVAAREVSEGADPMEILSRDYQAASAIRAGELDGKPLLFAADGPFTVAYCTWLAHATGVDTTRRGWISDFDPDTRPYAATPA